MDAPYGPRCYLLVHVLKMVSELLVVLPVYLSEERLRYPADPLYVFLAKLYLMSSHFLEFQKGKKSSGRVTKIGI